MKAPRYPLMKVLQSDVDSVDENSEITLLSAEEYKKIVPSKRYLKTSVGLLDEQPYSIRGWYYIDN